MMLLQSYHIILFLSVTSSSIAIAKIAKTGCNDTCGNVKIPYPFGIGSNCSVNQWYIIDCNSSTPYLAALNHLQVLAIDLQNATVTLGTPRVTDCQNSVQSSVEIFGFDFGRSPFFFNKVQSKFVFYGCGSALMMDNGSVLTGCYTNCTNVTLSDRHNCNGIGCCQTLITRIFNSYSINFARLKDGACPAAFLVDEPLYHERRLSDPFIYKNTSSVPISIMWTLLDSDRVTCCYKSINSNDQKMLSNGTLISIQSCYYGSWSTEENPYMEDGCKENEPTVECRRCQAEGGHCGRDTMHHGGFICTYNKKRIPRGLIKGIIIAMTIVSVTILYILIKYTKKKLKKDKERNRRERFYERNGGLLLKQQQEADPSLVDKTIHFTSRELEKATNNFSEDRILGEGAQGKVYKGMLVDGRIVAVKESKLVDESQLEQFINEVVILSKISHRNVVKLLGCCLETEVPMLVSEFIPNGTLCNRLHNGTDEFPISFKMRLQIAKEVAEALAYLHSSISIPVYHRDIKTDNILLDDKDRAKISDFGISRFVSTEKTHLTTLVKGTFGYLDPEYFQSNQFTEKSDVYSFGVVLVELLTGERAILVRIGEKISLVAHFKLAMEEGRVMSIFDATVIKEGDRDTLLILADLAMRCLNMNGKYRPAMKEVATELEVIQISHIPSPAQMNTCPSVYVRESSMLTLGESSSTTFHSCNDSVNQ